MSYETQVRTWSNTDLLDVARHIDKDAFPERNRIIHTEIERRNKALGPDTVPPPQLSPSKYATFWRRVGAILLDGLILMPVTIGVHYLASASTYPVMQSASDFLGSLLFYLYSILLHGITGQTIGKMVTRVRVLDLSEEKLTMAQAITRDLVPLSLSVASFVVIVNVGLPIDLAKVDFAALAPSFVLGSIGFLWSLAEILTMATNRKRRAIHDFIAGSVVVRIGGRATSLHDPAKTEER